MTKVKNLFNLIGNRASFVRLVSSINQQIRLQIF